MKALLSIFIVLILTSSFAFAQGQQGVHDPGTGLADGDQGAQPQLYNQRGVQTRLRQGNYIGASGQQIQVREEANNRLRIRVQNVSAHTSEEILQERVQNRTQLRINLSSGRNAEIKRTKKTYSNTPLGTG